MIRITALLGIVFLWSCDPKKSAPPPVDTASRSMAVDSSAPVPEVVLYDTVAMDVPVTLPVLDAFLTDSAFVAEMKTSVGLTDTEIDSLRAMAREETAKLREVYEGDYPGSTYAARAIARERIESVIGKEKGDRLIAMVGDRWGGGSMATAASSDSTGRDGSRGAAQRSGGVPSDTRIVVNAPAYRMDIFQDGALVKTYTIGVGYPEFPLPMGERLASEIIFNPTWTPPDEPWVEGSRRVQVGKTVPAGSSLNPLGIAKIPIGLPSLIHSGKKDAQLGGFASHGCVGMTDVQMRDFSVLLAEIGGAELNDTAVKRFGKNRKETQTIKLTKPVPVELRYETIVVQNGQLYIYRDVYDHNTNSEVNLRRVLAGYGVTPEQLTPEERTQVMAALKEMSRDAGGKLDSSTTAGRGDTAAKADGKSAKKSGGSVTRKVKGRKEVVIPVAALQGKGYPAPMHSDDDKKKKELVDRKGDSLVKKGRRG